ncbi:MAG: site-specific integrase [Phenylobacterium sp.]|uniref:tyrosine-type recombinase/integrase n=1 Tax=Phenylobacterium sp. TaxID=1871053 RepID=UPI0025FC0B2B|nr:site-specific integrase [Phenylobacterium sp.]MCG9916907.1 site-specific integrase [Phenylobacterium sp.]
MNLRQKPSGIWVVDFEGPDGNRRRVSTGLRDKREAAKRAREIVLGIDTPPPPSTAPRPGSEAAQGLTMASLFDLCCKGDGPWSVRAAKSQRTVKSNVKILTEMLGSEPVSSIGVLRLNQLRDGLFARGYAPATVKRKLDAVSRALTYAVSLALIPSRPAMPSVKIDNLQDRVLEDDEEAAIWAAIDRRIAAEPQRQWTRFRHLIRWLLDTACRLGEPLQASPSWVATHRQRAVLEIPAWATKTGKPRAIPLSEAVVETLTYLRVTATNDKLFDMLPATVWYMWDTIRADVREQTKLNIDDVKLHTLRHTCLTRLLRGGLPLHKVSIWAGHANVKITLERYAKVNVSDLMDGLDILDAPPTPHLKAVSA